MSEQHVDEAQWAVAVEGRDSDLLSVGRELRDGAVSLQQISGGEWLLTTDTLDGMADAGTVRKSAERTVELLNGAAPLIDPGFQPLKAGHVYCLHPDGRRDAFVLIETAIEARARVSATLTSSTHDEEPSREPTSPIDKALVAASSDAHLAAALRLNMPPRAFASLYKVLELSMLHPRHEEWSSKTQRSRFKHSANSPGAHGRGARHAVENSRAPANPMSLREAEAFIDSILTRWIDAAWDSLDTD